MERGSTSEYNLGHDGAQAQWCRHRHPLMSLPNLNLMELELDSVDIGHRCMVPKTRWLLRPVRN